MAHVILHLGSNIGDCKYHIQSAYEEISQQVGEILKTSKYHKTSAWGNENQPDFTNSAVSLETSLSPFQLIKSLQKIELNLGRVKNEKWGPRVIDIDIIFYNDLILKSSTLNIPHLHFRERRFVIDPIFEIAPDFIDPVSNMSIEELQNRLYNI